MSQPQITIMTATTTRGAAFQLFFATTNQTKSTSIRVSLTDRLDWAEFIQVDNDIAI